MYGNFPGGPVARIMCFHCRGHGFDPWLGNPTGRMAGKQARTQTINTVDVTPSGFLLLNNFWLFRVPCISISALGQACQSL